MITKILSVIKKYNLIEHGETVIVGVSGGPDSICLLHVLNSIADSLGIRLFVVHVNHMLRGEESERDEQYVKGFCDSLKIPVFVSRIDVSELSKNKGISIEEAGRETRYAEFERYADKTGAARIAVAHNRNDQAETVLMNIIRGTGLPGLKGMDYKTGKIIRPLLDIPRAEIEDYCRINSLNPRIDSSNLKNKYVRNKVRLDLIPYINELFKTNIVDSVLRMASLLREDYDFIENEALHAYDNSVAKCGGRAVELSLDNLTKAHPAIMKRMVRCAVKQVKGGLKDIQSVHIDSVINLCLYGRSGSRLCLPQGIIAVKSYKTLKIERESGQDRKPAFCKEVKVPGTTFVEAIEAYVEASIENFSPVVEYYRNVKNDTFVQFFDYDKLKEGINIRNRRNGDIFKPYRSIGTKKLKEYMIDSKIPRDKRDEIPLIAKDREIVWMIGYKTSDKFKVTGSTKNVLRIEYKGKKTED